MSRPKVIAFRFGEHAITAVITLAVAYFSFAGTKAQTNADLVDTLFNQVRELEKRVFEQNAMIADLQIELAKKYEGTDVIKDYIDAMPYPSWIKLVDVDSRGQTRFTMYHINREYEQRYSVTHARYFGRTDFQVWPEHVARSFYDNDVHVLQSMDYHCKQERFTLNALQPESTDNPSVAGYVCKWPTKINGRTAIAGIILQRQDMAR